MGAAISTFLFQPPKPPTYSENNKNVFFIPVKSEKGAPVPEVADEDNPSEAGLKVSTNKEKENLQIAVAFLEYSGSDLCIVYSHGNATDLGQNLPFLDMLRQKLRINVLGYEYLGYGISQPNTIKASERNCYDSCLSAINYVREVKNIPENKVILFGTSLGSGPTIEMALRFQKQNKCFRGIILQSGFTSVLRIKTISFFLTDSIDQFKNVDKISGLDIPVFIIHGKADKVVPFSHAQTMEKKAKHPWKSLFIDGADHNNVVSKVTPEVYLRKIYEYIVHLNTFHNERAMKLHQKEAASASDKLSNKKEKEKDENKEIEEKLEESGKIESVEGQ